MGKTRKKLTRRLEDYLEAVLVLVRRRGVARVRDIARLTDVSKSTVTAALKQLAKAGLVHHDPYQLVTLTPRGEAVAEVILHKHEILAEFLSDVLNVDAAQAEENACRMEHVVDDEVLRRMTLLAEFIQSRPLHSEDLVNTFAAYCQQQESPTRDPSTGD